MSAFSHASVKIVIESFYCRLQKVVHCILAYLMYKHLNFSGNSTVDQIIEVLLSTSMFVGGFVAFVLDNLLPGTYWG